MSLLFNDGSVDGGNIYGDINNVSPLSFPKLFRGFCVELDNTCRQERTKKQIGDVKQA